MLSESTWSSMLNQFPVVDADRILRRTLVSALITGVIGSIVAILLGHWEFAPGLMIGLVMGLINHRIFQKTAMHFADLEKEEIKKRPFAGSVFARLMVCTLIAVGVLLVAPWVGWGIIAGLAVFQGLLSVSAGATLYRLHREGAAHA